MSFSSDIKNSLCTLNVKQKCCKKSLIYGMLFSQSALDKNQIKFVTDNEKCFQLLSHSIKSVFGISPGCEAYEKLTKHGERITAYRAVFNETLCQRISNEYKGLDELFNCQGCKGLFARGLFLSCGTVNDPESSYHLEFSVSDPEKCTIIQRCFDEEGISLKITTRRGVISLYVKKSEIIEDILTFIGASNFSIKIMDVKIVREIRNNENRKSNCDAANIYKSTGAAAFVIKMINRLSADGKLDGLNEQLKITAKLRLEHPEMSMSELASIHEPPITKSGLSHRLAKITEYYEKCYGNEEE